MLHRLAPFHVTHSLHIIIILIESITPPCHIIPFLPLPHLPSPPFCLIWHNAYIIITSRCMPFLPIESSDNAIAATAAIDCNSPSVFAHFPFWSPLYCLYPHDLITRLFVLFLLVWHTLVDLCTLATNYR
jgi:hypothetical protein